MTRNPESKAGPEEEGQDAPARGAGPRQDAPVEVEGEDVAGRPDSPVPTPAELRAALAWAFDGEEIAPAVLEQFARHALMMLEANRVVNLTAVVEPREVAAKHYLDSWRVTRQVPLVGRRVLDLGSGAGFPGIPIAMTEPEVHVTLLDSTQKRVNFLSECIVKLGLKNVTAVWDRAEEHLARNNYDVVLMRAVSSVRENVRTLRKVRHSHKDLVMLKGPSWSREVRAGEREAERLGFRLDTVWEHKLPEEMGARAILVYRAPGAQGG
jgi:16S rRNA (guanine527-N7)-methyltransferase